MVVNVTEFKFLRVNLTHLQKKLNTIVPIFIIMPTALKKKKRRQHPAFRADKQFFKTNSIPFKSRQQKSSLTCWSPALSASSQARAVRWFTSNKEKHKSKKKKQQKDPHVKTKTCAHISSSKKKKIENNSLGRRRRQHVPSKFLRALRKVRTCAAVMDRFYAKRDISCILSSSTQRPIARLVT